MARVSKVFLAENTRKNGFEKLQRNERSLSAELKSFGRKARKKNKKSQMTKLGWAKFTAPVDKFENEVSMRCMCQPRAVSRYVNTNQNEVGCVFI